MAEYFIIRDSNGPHDVHTVWNYMHRTWCVDVDGLYLALDGFAYTDVRSARKRLEAVKVGDGRVRNVRIANRDEMARSIRGDD